MTEFNVGSMQEDMQRLTAAELLKLIVKKKMSIKMRVTLMTLLLCTLVNK